MKWNATPRVARDGLRRAAVVAVTNGRLDGSTPLTRASWHLGADLVSLDGRRRKRVLVKVIGEQGRSELS